MLDWAAYGISLLAIASVAIVAWVYSLYKQDVSIVDSLWSLFFLLLAVMYSLTADHIGSRTLLILILVILWALRLAIYITWRNWGEGEDDRYQKIRQNNEPNFAFKSLYIVFGLQALLAAIIALPLLLAMSSTEPLGGLDYLAMALWGVGMVFETLGDYQLARFKAQPENQGEVMDRGLWRYTRHPNYFGEFCIWWGYYLLALSAGAWWTIFSPILMTVLLLRVSGVTLLEQDITERRPAYAEYKQRTNAFFPGPRRPALNDSN